MAGKTNELVAWTNDAPRRRPRRMTGSREYDVVVASGEQVTAGCWP